MRVYEVGFGGAAGYFTVAVHADNKQDPEGGTIDGEAVTRRALAKFFKKVRKTGGRSRRLNLQENTQ